MRPKQAANFGQAVMAVASAYHEAGHAVVGIHLGRGLAFAAMAEGDCNAFCRWTPVRSHSMFPMPRRGAEVEILIRHVGAIAEAKYLGPWCLKRNGQPRAICGGEIDMRQALDFAWKATGNIDEGRAMVKELQQRSRELVESLWPQIVTVAKRLVIARKLSGRRIRAILSDS